MVTKNSTDKQNKKRAMNKKCWKSPASEKGVWEQAHNSTIVQIGYH